MNRRIVSVICVVLFTFSLLSGLFILQTNAYSNLIVNGSCEGPTGWGAKVPNWSGSGNGNNTGGYLNSSCIIAWSGANFNTYQNVTVSANTNYQFKFWASFAKAADAGKPSVKVTGSGISDQILPITGTNGVGNWYSCVFTTGASTSTVTVSFISPNTVTGNVYVDEFSLIQVDLVQDSAVNILVNPDFQSVTDSTLNTTTATSWTNATVRKDLTPNDYRLTFADATTAAATQNVVIKPNARFKLSVNKVRGTEATAFGVVTFSVLKKSDLSTLSSFDVAYSGVTELAGNVYFIADSDMEYIVSIKNKEGMNSLIEGVSLNIVLPEQPVIDPTELVVNGDFQANSGVRNNDFIDVGKLTGWTNGKARKDYTQPDDFRLTFDSSGQAAATQDITLQANAKYKLSVAKVRGCGTAGTVRFSVLKKADGAVAGSFDVAYSGSADMQSGMYFSTDSNTAYTISIKNIEGTYSLVDGVSLNKVTNLLGINENETSIVKNGIFAGASGKIMPIGWSGQSFDIVDSAVSGVVPANDPNYLYLSGGAFTLTNQTKKIRQIVSLNPLRRYKISFYYKGNPQSVTAQVGFATNSDYSKVYSQILTDNNASYQEQTFYYSTGATIPSGGLNLFYEVSTTSATTVISPYLTKISVTDMGDAPVIIKGTNIVNNSAFSDLTAEKKLPSSWEGATFDKIEGGINAGEQAGSFTLNNQSKLIKQSIELEPNTSYTVSVYKKGTGGAYINATYGLAYNTSNPLVITPIQSETIINSADGSFLQQSFRFNTITNVPANICVYYQATNITANDEDAPYITLLSVVKGDPYVAPERVINGELEGAEADGALPKGGWLGDRFNKVDSGVADVPATSHNAVRRAGAYWLDSSTKVIKQPITVEALTTYEVSVFSKSVAASNSGSVTAMIGVGDLNTLAPLTNGTINLKANEADTEYIKYSFEINIGKSAPSNLCVFFKATETASGATATTSPYVTNISVLKKGIYTPPPELVEDGNFAGVGGTTMGSYWQGNKPNNSTVLDVGVPKAISYWMNDNNTYLVKQAITLKAKTKYHFSANVKGRGYLSNNTFFGIAENSGAATSIGTVWKWVRLENSVADKDYQTVSFDFTPASDMSACVYYKVSFLSGSPSGSPYFTGVSVTQIGDIGTQTEFDETPINEVVPPLPPPPDPTYLNRVDNGDFEAVTELNGVKKPTGWTASVGDNFDTSSNNSYAGNYSLRLGKPVAGKTSQEIYRWINDKLYAGVTYEYTVYARTDSGTSNLILKTSNGFDFSTTVSVGPEWKKYSGILTLNTNAGVTAFLANTGANDIYVDNVVITEYKYVEEVIIDNNNGIYYDKGDCGIVVKDTYRFIPVNSKIVAYNLDDSDKQQEIDNFFQKINKTNDYLLSITTACVSRLGTEVNFVDGTVEVQYPIPEEWQNETNLALIKIGADENPRIMQTARQGNNLIFETNEFTTYSLVKNITLATSMIYKPDTESSAPGAVSSSSSSNSGNADASNTTSSSISSDSSSENQNTNSSSPASSNSSSANPQNDAKNNNIVLILIVSGVLLMIFGGVTAIVVSRNKKNEEE